MIAFDGKAFQLSNIFRFTITTGVLRVVLESD